MNANRKNNMKRFNCMIILFAFFLLGIVSTANATGTAGSCGSLNSGSFGTAPTDKSQLCTRGVASSVTGNATTWSWTCAGTGTSGSANCSATNCGAAPSNTKLIFETPLASPHEPWCGCNPDPTPGTPPGYPGSNCSGAGIHTNCSNEGDTCRITISSCGSPMSTASCSVSPVYAYVTCKEITCIADGQNRGSQNPIYCCNGDDNNDGICGS